MDCCVCVRVMASGFVVPDGSVDGSPTKFKVQFGAPLDKPKEPSLSSIVGGEAYCRDVTFDCPLKGCPPEPSAATLGRSASTGSDVLSADQASVLATHLPPALAGYKWTLVYSLTKHGASLETLVAKCNTTAPTLLVLKDTKGCVFGGYVSEPWRRSTSYYGSGQSFVFSFHNSGLPKATRQSDVSKYRAYKWSRENSYFQNVTMTYLCMGGGGAFAIYLVRAALCDVSTAISALIVTFALCGWHRMKT
jgi:hypothetical protein